MQDVIANQSLQIDEQKKVLQDLQDDTNQNIEISKTQIYIPSQTGSQLTQPQLDLAISKASQQLIQHIAEETRRQQQKLDALIETGQRVVQSLVKVTEQQLDENRQQLMQQQLKLQNKFDQVEVHFQKTADLLEKQLLTSQPALHFLKEATDIIDVKTKLQVKQTLTDEPSMINYKRSEPVKYDYAKQNKKQIQQHIKSDIQSLQMGWN